MDLMTIIPKDELNPIGHVNIVAAMILDFVHKNYINAKYKVSKEYKESAERRGLLGDDDFCP